MSQTFVWLFLMQRSFAAAADLKPKSALFGQIQCPAATKVEQNLPKLKKCSTADSKSASRTSKSRTKSPKIEKIFYRRLKILIHRLKTMLSLPSLPQFTPPPQSKMALSLPLTRTSNIPHPHTKK